ncbi:hypothetical protein STEG23_033608, partial [Scotinomys teguina]
MTVTPLGRDQDCSLKIREPDVPAPFGSWILEVGARPPLACTSSSLESVPCPLSLRHQHRPWCRKTMDPDMAFSSSPGPNIITTPGCKQASHIGLLLTAFTIEADKQQCHSCDLRYKICDRKGFQHFLNAYDSLQIAFFNVCEEWVRNFDQNCIESVDDF